MKKIYLAGPDVFFINADDHFEALESACAALNMVGIRPSDGGLSRGINGTKHEIARRIYCCNMELIRDCDGVLANVMPFRGKIEPDSGTCFEIGAAIAFGKPVAAYLSDGLDHYADKVAKHFGCLPRQANGLVHDRDYGFMIEEFDLPMNIMISCSSSMHSCVPSALQKLALDLGAKSIPKRNVPT